MFTGGRLRTRLVLALLGLALLSTALLGALAVYRLQQELYEQFEQRGQLLAHHLTETAFFSAYIQGQTDLVPMAESALSADVKFVEIIKDDRVLGSAGVLPPEPFLEIWQSILNPQDVHVARYPRGASVAPPAASSYVRLGISLGYLNYEMRQELLWMGLTGLGVALLALIAAWVLSGVILRPLARVTEALRRFGRGELTMRAPSERSDELGELARAFNQMTEAIVQMRGELERANRAKSEFITLMGHELRTPLNVLLGYLELLLEGLGGRLSAEQRKYLESALRSGEHLQALLANVLNYAKLELGVERLYVEDVNLSQLIRETVESLQHLASEKALNIESSAPDVHLQADRTKLRQILFNLLQNAIRYTPSGGRIHLGTQPSSSAEASQAMVELWVRDSGPGVPAEVQAQIFEPFVRLGNGEAEGQREGLGLGLAVVKRYAELHGGRAWVESTLGQGSTFYVLLPLRAREGQGQETQLSSVVEARP